MNHQKMTEARQEKQQEKLTEEEIKKLSEERAKDWEAFIKKLENNPTANVTNEDLLKVIKVMSEDMGGLVQLVQSMYRNMGVLNNNLNQLAGALGVVAQPNILNRTKNGIIIP
ncbi:MAG: hypothetical protein QXG00_06535 [Candidatus Woesearchaeota archaeon]